MFFRKKHKQHDYSDAELLSLFSSRGDKWYAGVLFQRYSHLIYGVCLKYLKNEEDSKDAVMSIVEKLLVDLPNHRISNFKSWLYTVTRNHCLMAIRSRKGITIISEDSETLFMEIPSLLHPIEENEMELELSVMETCIEQLTMEQNRCIRLFYLEEKTYKEVAESTGFDLLKVKSYLQNGKRNLKLCMESQKK